MLNIPYRDFTRALANQGAKLANLLPYLPMLENLQILTIFHYERGYFCKLHEEAV
jgi:hypothetical protein